jgi:hypothetical protein
MAEQASIRSAAGFIAPTFDVPEDLLYHCDLCALAPVRIFFPPEAMFYVVVRREPRRWRWFMRLCGWPVEWHEVVFFAPEPLRLFLPSFSATRGGIHFS